MTDRPILFSAPMVRALLDGRKTQTRRLAWRGELTCCGDLLPGGGCCGEWAGERKPTIWQKVKPGDRLWVRETWGAWPTLTGRVVRSTLLYRADNPGIGNPNWRWCPSIHMSRWASRLTLVVTETRVERLQEISDEDAADEGASDIPGCVAVRLFQDIWNEIHGPGSWQANPEVVALTFTVHHRNIDSMESAA